MIKGCAVLFFSCFYSLKKKKKRPQQSIEWDSQKQLYQSQKVLI